LSSLLAIVTASLASLLFPLLAKNFW